MIRWLLANAIYRPHTFGEVSELVIPGVAARLDPDEKCGIHWFNREKTACRTLKEPEASGGRPYRKRNPREDSNAAGVETSPRGDNFPVC